MLSPKAKKTIGLSITIFAACLISSVSLTYLLFLSPDAKARGLENSADKNYFVSRQIISNISDVAEMSHKATGLQEASEYDLSREAEAKNEALEANNKYNQLINKYKVSAKTQFDTGQKIKAIDHLNKSANYYSAWIKEARTAVKVINYANESFEQQEAGLKLINEAISEINDGESKQAIKTTAQITSNFEKARTSLVKAKKEYHSRDISKLITVVDLYIDSSDYLSGMAKVSKYEVDKYNKYVEDLNTATQKAAKISASNPIVKDLNKWLEKNFYYKAAKLVFHFKKSEEILPSD